MRRPKPDGDDTPPWMAGELALARQGIRLAVARLWKDHCPMASAIAVAERRSRVADELFAELLTSLLRRCRDDE